MKFTDIFIHKPVLAMVVSLFIMLLGLRAGTELNVRMYPFVENSVITVTTAYVGADADLVQGFITTPLEREIATAEGIDYLTSTSGNGMSTIRVAVREDVDADEVFTQVLSRVNKLRSELPTGSEDPVILLSTGDDVGDMYLSFASESMGLNQITDYLIREVEPKLATIPGVLRANIEGNRAYAMRIWLDPARMAALDVTASEVRQALISNNVLSAVGSTKGSMMMMDLKANTDLNSPEQFEDIVLRQRDNTIVRLRDVADVELGSESYSGSTTFTGVQSVFIAINVANEANSLDVIQEVRRVWDNEILPQLPQGLVAEIPYDATNYIRSAISDVQATIIEAVVIVIVVIFLFLGSLRSVIIPAIAVPLSLVGALFLMLLMGFSINLLTLLAMVLAIGIVVDDAIIILENIHRHVEEGMSPFEASLRGARELAWPIVAMTTTLVAVYLPIGFVGGLTGTMFTEFAYTLAGAVLLSGVIALTLSPMMCARLLKPKGEESAASGRLAHWLDARFERLRLTYQRDLHKVLDDKGGMLIFGAIVLVSCYYLYASSPAELAPEEDTGFLFYLLETDPNTSLEYVERFSDQLADITRNTPEIDNNFLYNGVSLTAPSATNGGFGGFVFKPWDQRDRSSKEVLASDIQPRLDAIAGAQIVAVVPSSMPIAGTFPVEFVIGTTDSPQVLHGVGEEILARAYASGKFIFLNTDIKYDRPRQQILIDRDKAALMGVDMQTLSNDLSTFMAGAYVNRFSMDNRSYRVIPQVQRQDRMSVEQLAGYYTRASNGQLVPLSTLVRFEDEVQPQALKRFQQLNAMTISGVPRPGVSLGDALAEMEQIAAEVMPYGYSIDYSGESRQYKREGSALVLTFFFALVVIYLVLAAQFESFRDPIIMLVTVPMSICGALLFLNILAMFQVPGATLNIYSQVGLLTLIGVISKHGILIVEFANRLQLEGMSKREAIEEASSIRLRPVLMTTAALVLAMIPLLTATGPGAVSRFSMGLIIAAGMTVGTLFTLYVLPAVYLYIGRDYSAGRAAREASLSAEGETPVA